MTGPAVDGTECHLDLTIGDERKSLVFHLDAARDLRALMEISRQEFNEGRGFWLGYAREPDYSPAFYWLDADASPVFRFVHGAFFTPLHGPSANQIRFDLDAYGVVDFLETGFNMEGVTREK